jgi:hypothetical protein
LALLVKIKRVFSSFGSCFGRSASQIRRVVIVDWHFAFAGPGFSERDAFIGLYIGRM